jgi:hypothetical protein
MSCCSVHTRARPHLRDSVHPSAGPGAMRAAVAETNRVPVLGTWDFKWPLDSVIRVAFQRVPGHEQTDLDGAAEVVEELAMRWTHGNSAKPHAAIRFDFRPDGWFEADSRYRWIPAADRRDPLDGTAVRDPEDERQYRARQYDVLVSFNPFPRAPREVHGGAMELPFLPFSALGSYARRIDYYVPTLHVGPIGNVPGSLTEYYRREELARFYVLHELGHVLGMIHEHQNSLRPERQAAMELLERAERLRSQPLELQAELVKQQVSAFEGPRKVLEGYLKDRARAQSTPDPVELTGFLIDELLVAWPGNPEFSDLREWRAGENSVMDAPYWRCVLGLHRAKAGDRCDECESALLGGKSRTDELAPFPGDIEHLKRMYPL